MDRPCRPRHRTSFLVDAAQVAVGRPVEDLPEPVEPRAVARAVPRLLRIVPGDDAAQVRTGSRSRVHGPLLVAVDRDPGKAPPEHGTRARTDFLGRSRVA